MDKILFSERLIARRKECGYKTQNALAKEYNKRFSSSRRDKKEENKENTSGILGTIKHYENANYNGSPKLEIVMNLCEILNCDIDYLIGKIDCKTHDTQFIHDRLGLSYNTIEHITSLNKKNDGFICMPIIDYFLGNTDFTYFLMKKIDEYYKKYESFREADSMYGNESQKIYEDYGNNAIAIIEAKESGEIKRSVTRYELTQCHDIADAKRFQIQKEFDNILIDLVKYYYALNHSTDNKAPGTS